MLVSVVVYTSAMKLILAQGNPGPDYARTRHNVGWFFLDAFAEAQGATFTAKPKFFADIAEYTNGGEKVLLVKPTTFYNETGRSARALMDFYKLAPEDILVLHDDLALPLGTLRTRIGGSSAGNNGIKSISAHVGEGTARLRIGIFDAEVTRAALHSVLGVFNASERGVLEELMPTVNGLLCDFAAGTLPLSTVALKRENPATE